MRFFMGLVLALALGVMGCSETSGTGGTAGMGGGGVGGDGGYGGVGGGEVTDCTGVEGGTECVVGDTPGFCGGGDCIVLDCSAVEEGTHCIGLEAMGLCVAGSCEMLEPCENDDACKDNNDCRADTCLSNGLCEERGAVQDGTPCAGGACEGGVCALETSVLPCSEQGIRNAIAAGDGPHTFDCDGSTAVVTAAAIAIDNDVILDGEGNLIVDGNENHTVLFVTEGVTAELRGLTATGGVRGIFNRGTLMLTNSTVSGNTTSQSGGGILNERGTLTLIGSIVSGNTANGWGGGIHNDRGALTLISSVVSGNTANGWGGGAGINTSSSLELKGALTLIDSTVSGNDATSPDGFGGGGIRNGNSRVSLINSVVSGNHADAGGGILSQDQWGDGALTLVNSTVSGNTASERYRGGGFYIHEGTVKLTNSTVFGNSAGGILISSGAVLLTNSAIDGDCELLFSLAEISSNGYNIESPGDTCGFDQGTDQVDVTEGELNLGPLQDNGGPTETHALLPGSVAIDQIPAVDCVDADDQPLTTDQRGQPRPGGSMCDVGAFEVQP